MQKLDFSIENFTLGELTKDVSDKEQWITVKGNHILVKAGETKASAIERFVDAKYKKKKPLKKKVEEASEKVRELKTKTRELEEDAKRLMLLEKKGKLSEWEKEMKKHLKDHTWKYAISQMGAKPKSNPKVETKHKTKQSTKITIKKRPEKKVIEKKKPETKVIEKKKLEKRSPSKEISFSAMLGSRIMQRILHPPKEDMLDFIITEIGNVNNLRFDSIDLTKFTQTTNDSMNNNGFTVLHGAITRSGDFPYIKNGKKITYVKEWDNIKETFSRYSYIPLKATTEEGAHHANILGYLANWKPHEDTEEMYADFVLFDKIENLTDLLNPEEGYHVSLGYPDIIKNGNRQIITGLDHAALSLKNLDRARACYGINPFGASCTTVKVVNHDQQTEEVMV